MGKFHFRYNYRQKLGYDDEARALQALKGIEGKRLTYRRTDSPPDTAGRSSRV